MDPEVSERFDEFTGPFGSDEKYEGATAHQVVELMNGVRTLADRIDEVAGENEKLRATLARVGTVATIRGYVDILDTIKK
jgi:hypothetical protein